MDTQLIIPLTQALQSIAETNRYMANLFILNTGLVAAGIILGIGGLLLLGREVRQVAKLVDSSRR